MGIFNIFKKKEQTILDKIDKSDWIQVFSACLGKSIVIQQKASELVVKGQDWNVDFAKGMISFGKDEYPIQFIGSESNISNTWNWGYNNVNHFSSSLLSLANEMYDFGIKHELEPLRVAQFKINEDVNGHVLSIVSCGLSEKRYFYYRCPHSNGAAFVAVENVPEEVFSPISMMEFINVTMQCIKQFSVDHKIFVESLLQWNKTSYTCKKDTFIIHFTKDLYITFDEMNRITELNTKELS